MRWRFWIGIELSLETRTAPRLKSGGEPPSPAPFLLHVAQTIDVQEEGAPELFSRQTIGFELLHVFVKLLAGGFLDVHHVARGIEGVGDVGA